MKEDLTKQGALCDICEFRENYYVQKRAIHGLTIVKDQPSKRDIEDGNLLSGQEYYQLKLVSQDIDLPVKSIGLTAAVLCDGDLDAAIKKCRKEKRLNPIECCSTRLKNDLSNAQVLVPMGKNAYDALEIKGAHFASQRGHPIKIESRWVLPTYDLLTTLRSARHLTHVSRDDIVRAAKLYFGTDEKFSNEYKIVYNLAELPALFNRRVMIDIETDGLGYDTSILCIGFTDNDLQNYILPIKNPDGTEFWNSQEIDQIKIYFQEIEKNCELEFQNGAFDTSVLLFHGFLNDRNKTWNDLALVHASSRENSCPHNLDFISTRTTFLPYWKDMVEHGKAIDHKKLWEYNSFDVRAQWLSIRKIEKWVEEDKTQKQLLIGRSLLPIARDMGILGLCVDTKKQLELKIICEEKIKDLEEELKSYVSSGFNFASPVQVKKLLYTDKTFPFFDATGEIVDSFDQASTGEKALLRILSFGIEGDKHKIIDKLLVLRGYSKLLSTYLTDTNLRPHPDFDHLKIMHPNFLVWGTVTGRFSSTPNVQNIPSRGLLNIKKMFCAPPGHRIAGADFDQVEARIFAVVAEDRLLLDAFKNNKDAHSLTAAIVFGPLYGLDPETLYQEVVDRKNCTDEGKKKRLDFLRFISKTIRFAKQYGAKDSKLVSLLSTMRDKGTNELLFPNIKADEIRKWDQRWNEMNPWIEVANRKACEEVNRLGYVEEQIHERKRYFPDGYNSPNEPFNFKIQGAAAAFANKALIAIHNRVGHRRWSKHSGVFLQVHDSIELIVPEDRCDEAKLILEESMNSEIGEVKITATAEIKDNL